MDTYLTLIITGTDTAVETDGRRAREKSGHFAFAFII
jgi:hypothetical protein